MRQAEPDERDEALRILYRLRAVWTEHDHAPPTALKAVESLIQEYEQEQEAAGGPADRGFEAAGNPQRATSGRRFNSGAPTGSEA